TPIEVRPVHVGDLQLPPFRGPDLAGDLDYVVVVEVEPGHGVVGPGVLRLLLDRQGAPVRIQVHHAVTLRVTNVVPEDVGASRPRGSLQQLSGEAVAVEDVVAENQGRRIGSDERLPNDERLRESLRSRLYRVLHGDP